MDGIELADPKPRTAVGLRQLTFGLYGVFLKVKFVASL